MRLQSREDLIADLQSKKFRDAFVSSRVSNTLALQIRAMRQERGWSQAYLGELLGTSQNAVYRLESPQYGKPSITTLKRLASIFDVGLSVWFSPFSKLVDRVSNLSTDDILVPSFDNDPGLQDGVVASSQIQPPLALASDSIQTISLVLVTNTNDSLTIDMKLPAVVNRTTGENRSFGINQNTFDPNVKSVSFGNTLLASVQLVVINHERESRGVRRYVGELVGTTEAA